jgi:ketosteroid isomerase-like protein
MEGETVVKDFKVIMASIAVLAVLIHGLARAAAQTGDKQAITNLERQLATSTTGDEVMNYLDGGEDVSFFDMNGPPLEFAGQKAIRDHIDKDFSGYKDVKVNFLELKVISDGKLALATSVQHVTSKGPDGKPVDIIFRQTDLWRNAHGQWKLVHSHASFPVDIKTGMADMGSKM